MDENNKTINEILDQSKTVAIIGISCKPNRASNDIARYLIKAGYSIFPVNPNYDEVLGMHCYKNLSEIKENIDIVNIFRRSSETGPIVDEAIKVKAGTVWMQLDIVNEVAAKKAIDAGLTVVMDKCIKVEHLHSF